MKKFALAVGVAGLIGAGVAAPLASAAPSHPALTPKLFKVTLSTYKPHAGQAITATGTGAEKNASFHCVELLIQKGHTPGASNAWLPTLRTPSSNAKGKVVCKDTFAKFHLTLHGKKHYCPPTRADKNSGWSCGMVEASSDSKSVGIVKFRF
jgi:hypothetical protein